LVGWLWFAIEEMSLSDRFFRPRASKHVIREEIVYWLQHLHLQ